MVTLDLLEERRGLSVEGDLAALLSVQRTKAESLLDRRIMVPRIKATLSVDGGSCPDCHTPLAFDPWSSSQHRCPDCGKAVSGARHDGHWARAQHLWAAERAAHLAAVAAFTEDERFADKAREILREYHQLYLELPNRDNVLGPSHLFFSTYLESIWVTNYLAAAQMLRERGWLSEQDVEAINANADEAATIIGEFNEGMSNRQVWNAAALTAISVWFGDEELAETAIQGRTGLLGLLTDGFDDDGMWSEGENYHLFALRGLLIGLDWARSVGVDLLEDDRLKEQLGRAVMATAQTALPDFTFPARKDSRFGVSLAHPAYLECFERGLAVLGEAAPSDLAAWLGQLYQRPALAAQTYDAYLNDAGEVARARSGRADLSWWMLLGMEPVLPDAEQPYQAASAHLATQGVAILRQHDRYLALECGRYGGEHGHPDRLALTLHANGVPWLVDPGTGSYVRRDLFWYRSTLAHNAPRLDGVSQLPGEATCLAFDDQGEWGWISAEYGSVRRSVVQGSTWILDVVELNDASNHRLEVPWHLDGEVTTETDGQWVPDQLDDEFLTRVERFVPLGNVDPVLKATRGDQALRLHLVGGVLLRAEGPGRPGTPRRTLYLARLDSVRPRLVALIDLGGTVSRVDVSAEKYVVTEASEPTTVRIGAADVAIGAAVGDFTLRGAVPSRPPLRKMLGDRPIRSEGRAIRVDGAPSLDGTWDGFDGDAELLLEDESQYYRSEEPYPGPEAFAARAAVNWDDGHLYLAVEVRKPEVVVDVASPTPRYLDNEPDDIHLDGVQVYYRVSNGERHAFLVRPLADGGIAARSIPGVVGQLSPLAGAGTLTPDGYCLTVALPCPDLGRLTPRSVLEFDLLVNEAQPDRTRRAGQLAWGGGHGWVYLRGDRRPESQWGILELVP